ncbi:hypothetical protein OIU93_07475 [Paeniglutamicibacter sp. ZC-3]|uniref:hypothetical protein n=1 Tax=Paeniglutamicibacter sp. ZC-3 TaxID=2986919 RepID=UPI0021F721D9|nr:hypothetical protein [Paeniglutamicibacter sp. ZC-3]MCV9994139.1 hypothetical protein [Paeniglutamicibacter sp. ZC-3]
MDTYTPTAGPLARGHGAYHHRFPAAAADLAAEPGYCRDPVALEGKEPVILQKVASRLVGLLLVLCVLVYLQSTPILGWMLQTP